MQRPGREKVLKDLWLFLQGAEGEEEGQEPSPQESGSGTQEETFSRKYVEELRQEAAGLRTKKNEAEKAAKDAQAKLADIQKAEMDELERTKTELEEGKSTNESLLNRAKDAELRLAVVTASQEHKFRDLDDLMRFIDNDALKFLDDGSPDMRSVKAAVEKVAKDKPYLLEAHSTGSADGGARGEGEAKGDLESKVREHKERLLARGAISR